MSKDIWENYECDNQMSIGDWLREKGEYTELAKKVVPSTKRKPLKYYMSLSAYYTKCSYCGAENSEKLIANDVYECKRCHMTMHGVTEIKSKEYKECEALGLNGMVAKDEKRRWAEVHYDGKGNRYLSYGDSNSNSQKGDI